MIDKTHFRISQDSNQKLEHPVAKTESAVTDSEVPDKRMNEVEKRLAMFEEVLFDCAMTLKDKVADRLDQLEDLCHHETALLRQELQQEDHDRKKELNLLTLKISEAIDRIAAEKNRQTTPEDGNCGQKNKPRIAQLEDPSRVNRPGNN